MEMKGQIKGMQKEALGPFYHSGRGNRQTVHPSRNLMGKETEGSQEPDEEGDRESQGPDEEETEKVRNLMRKETEKRPGCL